MDKPWINHYPRGVPATLDVARFASLVEMIEDSFARHRALPAYRYMGRTLTFGEIDTLSRAFAAWLQSQGLEKGDRVALMMPNVPQYPVAVAAVLRAGCVIVNVNPLYTARELEYQLRDCGAKAIVILENFAHTLQQVIGNVPLRTVVVTALGDLLGFPRRAVVNSVVRHVKKMVPPWQLGGAADFCEALAQGRGQPLRASTAGPDDVGSPGTELEFAL